MVLIEDDDTPAFPLPRRVTRAQSTIPKGKLSHDDELSKALDQNTTRKRKAGRQETETLQSNARIPVRPNGGGAQKAGDTSPERPHAPAVARRLFFGLKERQNARDGPETAAKPTGGTRTASSASASTTRVKFVPARTPAAPLGEAARTRRGEAQPARKATVGEDEADPIRDSRSSEETGVEAEASDARDRDASDAPVREEERTAKDTGEDIEWGDLDDDEVNEAMDEIYARQLQEEEELGAQDDSDDDYRPGPSMSKKKRSSTRTTGGLGKAFGEVLSRSPFGRRSSRAKVSLDAVDPGETDDEQQGEQSEMDAEPDEEEEEEPSPYGEEEEEVSPYGEEDQPQEQEEQPQEQEDEPQVDPTQEEQPQQEQGPPQKKKPASKQEIREAVARSRAIKEAQARKEEAERISKERDAAREAEKRRQEKGKEKELSDLDAARQEARREKEKRARAERETEAHRKARESSMDAVKAAAKERDEIREKAERAMREAKALMKEADERVAEAVRREKQQAKEAHRAEKAKRAAEKEQKGGWEGELKKAVPELSPRSALALFKRIGDAMKLKINLSPKPSGKRGKEAISPEESGAPSGSSPRRPEKKKQRRILSPVRRSLQDDEVMDLSSPFNHKRQRSEEVTGEEETKRSRITMDEAQATEEWAVPVRVQRILREGWKDPITIGMCTPEACERDRNRPLGRDYRRLAVTDDGGLGWAAVEAKPTPDTLLDEGPWFAGMTIMADSVRRHFVPPRDQWGVRLTRTADEIADELELLKGHCIRKAGVPGQFKAVQIYVEWALRQHFTTQFAVDVSTWSEKRWRISLDKAADEAKKARDSRLDSKIENLERRLQGGSGGGSGSNHTSNNSFRKKGSDAAAKNGSSTSKPQSGRRCMYDGSTSHLSANCPGGDSLIVERAPNGAKGMVEKGTGRRFCFSWNQSARGCQRPSCGTDATFVHACGICASTAHNSYNHPFPSA